MAYSKRFNERKYLPIAPLTKQMQDLEEGGSVWVRNLGADEVNRLRFLLYDWLNQQALKPCFRIFTHPTSVEIRRRKAVFADFEVEEPTLSDALVEVLKELLVFDTEDEVQQYLLHSTLREEEIKLLIKEWKKVMQ